MWISRPSGFQRCVFDFCVLVWVQSRGFKTLRSKTRRTESGLDGPAESEPYTPAFIKVRLVKTVTKLNSSQNNKSASITGFASEGEGTRGAVAGPNSEAKECPRSPARSLQDGLQRRLHEISGLHSENTRRVSI